MSAATWNPCLVHVFNHRFEKNIAKLRLLYEGRFPANRFLVPYYAGNDEDVIRVESGSYCFQAYFPQGLARYFDPAFTHYVFLADDLLLNPSLNVETLDKALRVTAGSAYIKSLRALGEASLSWAPHLFGARGCFHSDQFDWASELPSRTAAERRFADHGLPMRPVTWRNLRGFDGRWRLYPKFFRQVVRLMRARGRIEFPYPAAMGYSDLVVVPADRIHEFCRVCSVFASMHLFAEVAIPTALVLTCDEIVHEARTAVHGVELWDTAEVAALRERHGGSLARLVGQLGGDTLYVHPVKLSQWELDFPETPVGAAASRLRQGAP